MNTFYKDLLFLKSALSYSNSFNSLEEVVQWIKSQNDFVQVNVKKIPFDHLQLWHFENGSLKHESGKFFSIEGICVQTNWGNINEWRQPIINQPEIGYLGFITKEFNGILHFLVQAKVEPGNINAVQLSPTLQATKSNYSKVHKGREPLYLEYFRNAKPNEILLDQLQSEQGARFLKKRNRNIIIKINESIPVYDNFVWLTLGQIKSLMALDNIVNMDTRTVISGIPYGNFGEDAIELFLTNENIKKAGSNSEKFLVSYLKNGWSFNTLNDIISFITRLKSKYDLYIKRIPLDDLLDWEINASLIRHKEDKYFKVIATSIEISNREVMSWTQPMIEPAQDGICAFICKEINGIIHFAVQAKLECGNFDIIEFAPSVQCLTGNYMNEQSIKKLPFLEYVLNAPKDKILFDSYQSEEGGRFYKEQNRNMIIMAGDEVPLELPEYFIWLTLNQLQTFIQFNNYINIQARSLLAAITFN